MMNMTEFVEKLKDEIREYLPEDVRGDIIIDDVEVVKMNDQKLHGLTFRTPESDAAPTLYVDDMFSAYKDGKDISELTAELANMYTGSRDGVRPPEVKLSYDRVKDNLTVRLLEKKRNNEFLSSMPYVNVGHGLAVIADINMGENGGGDWRVAVNNNVLEQLGVDRETLFADAMKNSAIIEPAQLVDMNNALFEPQMVNLLERDEPISSENVSGMYVLTNASRSLGAAAMFYPDVKEKAAEIIGGDYYILPSSCHEVILVPDTLEVKAKDLCEMVKEANRTVVEDKDILSDNVYHYSKDERRLDKVTQNREIGDRVAEGR